MTGATPPLRGRWAEGLEPRMFTWIIQDRLAGSERPGGFSRNHRRVRRQEELIWLKHKGFTRIISLLDSPHNLQAYEDAELPFDQVPLGRQDELTENLPRIFAHLAMRLDDAEERLLVHHEEFGDRVVGLFGGLLVYLGLVKQGAHAIQLIERLTNRNLGAEGREIIALTTNHGWLHAP